MNYGKGADFHACTYDFTKHIAKRLGVSDSYSAIGLREAETEAMAALDAKDAEIERLRDHFGSMPCPANGLLNQSSRTIGECQASGICECNHGPVLSDKGDTENE